nr:hypothetical protein [Tanacetum cinerariifolium]
MELYRNLRIVLSTEDKLPFLEQPMPVLPVPPLGQANPPDVIATHQAWVKAQKEIDGLMLITIDLEIQMTLEHLDHLKDHGIIAHRTPPYTPQRNRVSKKRNRTLLDMVRFMMSQTTLPKTFWDYAFESVVRILNMVPTKKVDKTPYEGISVRPANNKATLLDPESDKWLNSINVEMQSMKDNKVWELVVLPSIGKVIGHTWLFKKKTDMNGAVHTYKARLVAKGFTQTSRINYKETYYPVADIRAIRILISITAFYDLRFGKWIKSQGASTPAETQRLQNIPYALAVGLIVYAIRCTRLDVAFSQNITSRFQQNPGDAHWNAVKNILKYLRNTKDMFLVYEGVVGWKSTKQSIFATSSTNAEYIAAFDASKEAVWIRKFIFGLVVVPTIEDP